MAGARTSPAHVAPKCVVVTACAETGSSPGRERLRVRSRCVHQSTRPVARLLHHGTRITICTTLSTWPDLARGLTARPLNGPPDH